jgi:hypothetical protein
MLNHAYTLLLNITTTGIATPLRTLAPGFRSVALPPQLAPFQSALYADCGTLQARQERAEACLALLTTPELMPYTLKFDARNTYAITPATLLSMCTTDKTAGFGATTLTDIDTAVRLCSSLFTLPGQATDMDTFRRTYYTATDRHTAVGAALLAYIYQLEYVGGR